MVQGFDSPRAALAALRPGEFDLLLTDLMMPDMDGIELITAARLIDPAIGAIVMTGHGTIDTAVLAMKGGALDYILKPFRLNVIPAGAGAGAGPAATAQRERRAAGTGTAAR